MSRYFKNIAESHVFYRVFCISRLCCDPSPLHFFLQKIGLFFHCFFNTFWLKIHEKVAPGAHGHKNRLLACFFSIFGRLWGPLGGPGGRPFFENFVKRGDVHRETSNQSRFFCDFLIFWPLFAQSCVFDPLRASFWSPFWSFLVEIRAPFC